MSSHYEKFLATGEVKCIDDEIPFEIPDGWEWTRLGTIVDFSKSGSVAPNNISDNFWVLDLEDIEKGTGKVLFKKKMKDTKSRSDKHPFMKGNVLYSKLRPYLNKVVIADESGVCTSEILAFDFMHIYNRYAQAYLMSPFFVEYAMRDAYGVKMPRLGSKQGNNALMPVPPQKEQHRIVEALDRLSCPLNRYTKAQIQLDTLNSSVSAKLKSSILQEAIQGRLVPQNPDDEPASKLLERIREEKQKLLKEGKLKKKDITDSVIFRGDDNAHYEKVGCQIVDISKDIPFDLPSNWCWARLRDICTIMTGATFKKDEVRHQAGHGVRVLRGGNIYPFEIKFKNDDIFLDSSMVKSNILLKQNDLITPAVTSLENICKMARIDEDIDSTTVGGFVFIIRPLLNITDLSKYLLAVLSSPSLVEYAKSITNKSGQAFYNIGKERLGAALIPLPPLEEQNRITHETDLLSNLLIHN